MRYIHVEEGFRVRFPGQGEDFCAGVELGMLTVLMDLGTAEISRWIPSSTVEPARALAEKLGYRLIETTSDDEWTRIVLRTGAAKPKLRLVHSA